MTRVEGALTRQARTSSGSDRVVFVDREGHGELGTAHLRRPATIEMEFHSGSARPLVGAAIRLTKRAVRRSLRWYVQPMMEQQSRFNHAILDTVEQLRMHDEQLQTDLLALARLSGQGDVASGADLPSVGAMSRHRPPGDQVQVREMLRVQVPHFGECRRVVDLLCGGGEFLTLLREAGIPAYGVDADDPLVDAAPAMGIEAVHDDALTHLAGLEPGVVDGIFCCGLAERLETPQLLRVLELSLQKLAPGGVVVVVTPNPATFSIVARSFHTDLTRVRPIHPDALRWAMEAVGFEDVRIERMLPVEEGVRLEPVPEDLADRTGWAPLAANIDRLNGLLFGPQHFAAVAVSPRRQ